LTDTSDLDWRHTAVRIVEFLSSVWGGKHSLIIPSDGSTIDPLFWTILEKFSPDYVYFYRKTGRDVQTSRPEEYAVQLESIVRRYETEGAILEKNKEHINQGLGKAWADRFALNTNLCSDIASRLVPFHHAGHFEPITGHGYVPHNLTSIVDVLSCVDHPQSFASFQVPLEIDPVWWITNTGTYSAMFAEQLSGVGLNEKAIAVSNEDLGSFCEWVVGDFDRLQQATLEALGAGPEFMPPDPTCPTPFDVSMSRVGLYAPPLSHVAAADRFALILGDSLADFCLSYCLPRIASAIGRFGCPCAG
jgi:hypothetical protein